MRVSSRAPATTMRPSGSSSTASALLWLPNATLQLDDALVAEIRVERAIRFEPEDDQLVVKGVAHVDASAHRDHLAVSLTRDADNLDVCHLGRLVSGIEMAPSASARRRSPCFIFGVVVAVPPGNAVRCSRRRDGAALFQRLDRPGRPLEPGDRPEPTMVTIGWIEVARGGLRERRHEACGHGRRGRGTSCDLGDQFGERTLSS